MQFSNVSCVKGQENLIDICQMYDIDYEIHFNKKEGRVIDSKNNVVILANHHNHIYIFDMFFADNSLWRSFFYR